MNDKYAKACTEVLTIIPYIEQEYAKKIPIQFIKMMEQISDKEYLPKYDISKRLKEQELLLETRAILALIYRDYICTKEERETLLLQEKEESEKLEKEKQEKYNIDFETVKEKRNHKKFEEKLESKNKNTNALIQVHKEVWYKKILLKIIDFFKRK